MPRLVTAVLCVLGLFCSVQVAQAQQPVKYIYDELGRLVGVIDPNGESATYAYDAVGNILSITRRTPAQVSVIEFTPNGGPTSTQVTIQGTGFSATPNQNTVKFNGVTASVTSATVNKLVTSVPAGATTGTISVTAPGGSATSSSAFTVGPSSAPTVTNFTPTSGVAGASVTITGTNFETTFPNDRSTFNIKRSDITAATATSITTTVPTGGTSGKVSVDTPAGKGISSADFFVPPLSFTAADINFSSRMSIGGTSTATIGTANKIGLMLFDGTSSQRVSLKGTNGTIAISSVYIFKPSSGTLVNLTSFTPNGFIDATALPEIGSYQILVDPLSTYTGNLTLTLYNVPADTTGTITAGGSGVVVTLGTPGQNGTLTFSGTSSQRVSLRGTNGTIGINNISIKKPDGSTVVGPVSFTPNGFIDTQTLTATGTHTILVDPYTSDTGSATLTLYNVPADTTGTLNVNGSTVTVALTTPGQNGTLTFSGTASQNVTVKVTNNTIVTVTVKLLKPDGTVMTSSTSGSGSFNLAQQTLPTTGTYTVVIDPTTYSTGSLKVKVTNP